MNRPFLALLAVSLATSFARPAAAKGRAVSYFGGVSVTDARWSDGLGFNERLGYDFETKLHTKVEGKLAQKRTGLSVGVNADLDSNDVGKTNKVLGYVGIRRVFLRGASSEMKGSVTWNNSAQRPGFKQAPRLDFSSRYNYVDLTYHTKKTGMFFGVGYTSYRLPTEVKAYSSPDGERHFARVGAYDPDYSVKLYNFVFGWDSLADSVFLDRDIVGPPQDGFGLFFGTEDRFGIGNATIGSRTLQTLRDNNPGFRTPKATESYWLIENDTNIGIRWMKTRPSGTRIAVGLGYEYAFIIGTAFSGVSESPTLLELDPSHGLVRQGPIARFYYRW